MPYRHRLRAEEDEKRHWPVMPQPWWRDLKHTGVSDGDLGATWVMYLLGAVAAVALVADKGWGPGIGTIGVIGVVLAGASMLGDAFMLLWFRQRTSPTWWTAVKFTVVAAFCGLCVWLSATRVAVAMLALSAALFATPVVVLGLLGELKRNGRGGSS